MQARSEYTCAGCEHANCADAGYPRIAAPNDSAACVAGLRRSMILFPKWKNGMNKYKQAEQEIAKLVQQGRTKLWEIGTRCVALFNDSDAYAAEINISAESVVEHINGRFLRDFALELEDIIVLLQHFPEKSQWNRPVLDLLDEAHAKIAADKPERQHAATRRTVKLKEHEAVEAKLRDAEFQLERTSQSMADLRAENQELRRENARLEGRILELERMLSRRGEPAYV